MPSCFADITGITARTCKLVNNTRAKPARDRVFHAKQLAYLKGAHFSVVTQKKVRHLIKGYCSDLDIKLVFSSFQTGKLFSMKDPIPGRLHSCVVYKFACAVCNACYVGETTRHFSTCVREHLVSDKASNIFKHLQNSEHCRALSSVDCFHILDHASTRFQLKIKEAFHIQRQQPSLNQQVHHVNLI